MIGTLRAIARLLRVAGFLVVGTWRARRFSSLSEPERQEAVRAWLATASDALGVAIRVQGRERLNALDGQAQLWLPNHVSWLDIPVLGSLAPGAVFLAKSEIRHWPVIGGLAVIGGTEFIERGRGSESARAAVGHGLDRGHRMVVFAEGTTSDGMRVRRYHARLLGPAVERKAPVVPIAIRYHDAEGRRTTAPAFVDNEGILSSLWRVASTPGIEVVVDVLPPVWPTADESRSALTTRAREAVAAVVENNRETLGPNAQ
ncbi:MAG: lysophospholipid acyltransferase family protein [Pseudomonadota bacterium]